MGIDFDEWGFDDVSIENYLLGDDYQDNELSEHDSGEFGYSLASPYWDINDLSEDELDAFQGRGAYSIDQYFTHKERKYLKERESDIKNGVKIFQSNSLNLSSENQFLLKRDEILKDFDWSRLPRFAYHWIPLVSLKSILKFEDGLLSRTYLDIKSESLQKPTYLDISNRELSLLRSRTSLPDETLIADYVPFYFCEQPPMAYLAIKNGTTQRGIPPMEWAVIEISLADLIKNQWWAIDRHFRNTVRGTPLATNFLSELAEFNWSSILSVGKFDDRQIADFRQAEFLIHMKCPVSKWKSIIVSSIESEYELKEIDPLLSYKGVSVNVDPDFFALDRKPRNSVSSNALLGSDLIGKLQRHWESIAGSDVAKHVPIESFELDSDAQSGTIYMRAESSAWATQIRLLLPTISQIFGQEIDQVRISGITVLGPTADSNRTE